MKLLIASSSILLFTVMASCQKSQEKQEDIIIISKGKLLTEKPWKLFSYGRDLNDNGQVDIFEEAITNCEKAGIYSFAVNGSGAVSNTHACTGCSVSNHFQWSFSNNETELDFIYGRAVIVKLTRDSMVLSVKTVAPGKVMLRYKHI